MCLYQMHNQTHIVFLCCDCSWKPIFGYINFANGLENVFPHIFRFEFVLRVHENDYFAVQNSNCFKIADWEFFWVERTNTHCDLLNSDQGKRIWSVVIRGCCCLRFSCLRCDGESLRRILWGCKYHHPQVWILWRCFQRVVALWTLRCSWNVYVGYPRS